MNDVFSKNRVAVSCRNQLLHTCKCLSMNGLQSWVFQGRYYTVIRVGNLVLVGETSLPIDNMLNLDALDGPVNIWGVCSQHNMRMADAIKTKLLVVTLLSWVPAF